MTLVLNGPHLDLVNMLHLGLIRTGDSVPYLGIIGTWFHCMACRLASPEPENSSPYLGIIGTLFLCMACRLPSPGPGEWG